jgi:ABC-2 type transport system permease protein
MNWTLLRGTLYQRRTAIFWYCISLVLYSWMMVWFWDQMGSVYSKMLENYPQEILALFGGNEVSFATLGGFFQVEYLGLMWMIIIGSAVVLFAGRAFSGEIGSGTMEFLLAQPVSRARVAITRVVAFVAYALALNIATFVPIQLFGRPYGIELEAKAFWSVFALGVLFTLAIGGFAMLLSSMFRDSGKPIGIAAGVLLLFWVADMIGNVSDVADALDPVNVVSYWQPGKIINGGSAPIESWWLYGVIAIVSLAGAVVIFTRRDVA